MQRVRVVAVDRRRISLLSLRQKLSSDPRVQVVGEACTVRQAIGEINTHRPDVVVVADGLPGLRGLILAATLRRMHAGIGAVLIVDQSSDRIAVDAIRAGVAGLVEQQAPAQELVETVLAVARCETPLLDVARTNAEILRGLIIETPPLATFDPAAARFGPDLPPRLVGILDGVIMGMTNREIAQSEKLSEQTVSNYISSMVCALNTSGRIGVLREAIFHGWMSDSSGRPNPLQCAPWSQSSGEDPGRRTMAM